MVKIAIVEDDTVIAEELCKYLKEWNFSAVCIHIEKDILSQLLYEKADIIIVSRINKLMWLCAEHYCKRRCDFGCG